MSLHNSTTTLWCVSNLSWVALTWDISPEKFLQGYPFWGHRCPLGQHSPPLPPSFLHVSYFLMLLLAIIHLLMIVLCLELNYYSLNPKTILICIEQNITLISVIYISTDLKKTVSWLLRVLGRWKKDILKIISHRNLYLIHNTRGGVANTIKVLPI